MDSAAFREEIKKLQSIYDDGLEQYDRMCEEHGPEALEGVRRKLSGLKAKIGSLRSQLEEKEKEEQEDDEWLNTPEPEEDSGIWEPRKPGEKLSPEELLRRFNKDHEDDVLFIFQVIGRAIVSYYFWYVVYFVFLWSILWFYGKTWHGEYPDNILLFQFFDLFSK